MVQKIHGGSGIPHGHRNIGTAPKPSPTHGGSGSPKGQVHRASAPPSQRSTSWHAVAAQSKKRGG